MTPGRIVEPLDVVEHIRSGLVSCPIGFAAGTLGLQRREEALHRRVVPDIAGSAHAADDSAVGHQLLELQAGVLAALIGVVQQGIRLASAPDGHQQGVGDQLSGHASAIDFAPEPLDLLLLGLHLPLARKGLRRIGAELLDPFPQYILMNVEVPGGLAADTPRSFTSLTASTLNSR